MVYNELKIVWQTAKRIRKGRSRDRNLEFLEFLALEGDSPSVRRAAMLQYLDLTAAAQSAPAQGGLARRD